MMGRYDDIINLSAPACPERRKMSPAERAAQFAPFAALTGFEEEIAERARFTGSRRCTDEDLAAKIDAQLRVIADGIKSKPAAMINCYRPDSRKNGGEYVTAVHEIVKLEEAERLLVTAAGEKIPIDDIFDIELL